jgi:hypothetical protein
MPAGSNFPQGFKYGLTLRNMPLMQTQPGQVFWVCNSTTLSPFERGGSNGNDGTFNSPFATIAFAMTQCKANHGDIIMVKPNHAETISTAAILTLAVAGVAIIGIGSGSSRPTLTFTAAAANIPVTAANISIQNILFKANFLDVASVFTATGTATPTDFNIEGCEFRDGSSSLNFISIVTGNATANSMDGLRFVSNRISSLGTTAATTAIKINAAADRVTLLDNYGNWAVLNDTAAILAAGANNVTNFDMGRNVLNRPNTSSTGGSFVSTSATGWTGHAYDNYLWQLDASAGIWIATGTKLAFSNNFSPITGAADKSGLINPAAV